MNLYFTPNPILNYQLLKSIPENTILGEKKEMILNDIVY